MFDPERLLGSLLSDGLRGRPGRTLRRAALSPQGLMVLGGVAVAAYEHFVGQKKGQAATSAPPPPPGAPGAGSNQGAGALTQPPPPPPPPMAARPTDSPPPRSEAQVLTLIAAMANAAKADGSVDENERARMLARLDEVGAGPEERAFLAAELDKPLDLDGLLARVEGPVQGAEVYAASVAAIDSDTVAEQGYLSLLASRLGLPGELIDDIHARIAAARNAAQATSPGEGTSSPAG